MIQLHAAGVGVALGHRRDDDFADRLVRGVAVFGFIPPDDDDAVVLIRGRRHDFRNEDGKKIVADGDGLLVVRRVGDAAINEIAAQETVLVIILVRRDPVVTANGIVGQVLQKIRQRRDVLNLRIGVERHRVVLHGIIILGRAVVRIDCTAGTGGAVRRTRGALHVLLIIFPRDARRVQLAREMVVGENIGRSGGGIVVRVNPEIRPAFRPDVVRLGRMHADAGIVILRGIGNLHGVRVAGRDQAVDIRRGGVGENLLRAGQRAGLPEIVILHRNHEDGFHLLQNRRGLHREDSEPDGEPDGGDGQCFRAGEFYGLIAAHAGWKSVVFTGNHSPNTCPCLT